LNESQVEDPTDALKKFLFGNRGSIPSDSFATAAKPGPAPKSTGIPDHALASSPRSDTNAARNNNIEDMENDLRRILKLDMTSGSNPQDHAFLSR
jgi:hypothetical protein